MKILPGRLHRIRYLLIRNLAMIATRIDEAFSRLNKEYISDIFFLNNRISYSLILV